MHYCSAYFSVILVSFVYDVKSEIYFYFPLWNMCVYMVPTLKIPIYLCFSVVLLWLSSYKYFCIHSIYPSNCLYICIYVSAIFKKNWGKFKAYQNMILIPKVCLSVAKFQMVSQRCEHRFSTLNGSEFQEYTQYLTSEVSVLFQAHSSHFLLSFAYYHVISDVLSLHILLWHMD